MPAVSVLWGLGLLVAISISLLWNGSVTYRLAHNALDVAKTNAIAEAAVSRGVLSLLDPVTEQRWRTDGVARSFDFDGVRLKVAIQDELGRIDINQAEPLLLIGLLTSVGLDRQSATILATRILEWREANTNRQSNVRQEYLGSDGSYQPRKGAFQSVDEVLLVANMTPALFRRVQPALTVYSGRQFVNLPVAPREVLLALPNMSPDSIESVVAARTGQQVRGGLSADIGAASLRGRAFTIRTEFEKSNAAFVYETTVRLTDNPAQPFWTLNWRVK